VIAPSVEGVPGGPAVFDIHSGPGALGHIGMTLESCLVWIPDSSGCGIASPVGV
jgi:hypothetical protein